MDLIVATENEHKLSELREILPVHRVLSPQDLRVSYSHEETGTSFLSNALGKAMSLHSAIIAAGRTPAPPILADDSGICVDALGGRPGVYTARYGSTPEKPRLEAAERNSYLLGELEGVRDRGAHYVCCMVLYLGKDKFYVAQETWEGEIARQASTGSGGFGYDPVFLIPELGKTAADIDAEQKHKLSHRGKATRAVANLIASL